MRLNIISIAIVIALLATSCGHSHNNHNHEAVKIELNDGQKWKVNSEMIPYIEDSEKTLLQYTSNDYKTLAEQLQDKNNGLIKSCTMDGKSHDELHKWLHPHIELIEALENAKNKEEADKLISELKSSFKTYHNYFN